MSQPWQEFELDGETQYRAVLEGYLVFLRREPPEDSYSSRRRLKRGRFSGEWFVHFLLPKEERERAYLAGEGFATPTSKDRAQRIALDKARELRGRLERSPEPAKAPPRKGKRP